MNKKYLVIPALATMTLVAGALLANTGKAEAAYGNRQSSDSLAQELAPKLGLDQSKVSDAINQIRQEHRSERQATLSSNLDKAVAAGVINGEQKQQILDEHSKLSDGSITRAAFSQWLKDSGIDFSKLHQYGIGFGRFHRNNN